MSDEWTAELESIAVPGSFFVCVSAQNKGIWKCVVSFGQITCLRFVWVKDTFILSAGCIFFSFYLFDESAQAAGLSIIFCLDFCFYLIDLDFLE